MTYAVALGIVGDFDLASIPLPPCKTDSVLVVDADTVWSLPVAAQFLQSVAGRRFQILQGHGTV